MRGLIVWILFLALGVVSCRPHRHVTDVVASGISIDADSLQMCDSLVSAMIAPYKKQLDSVMGKVLGFADAELVKELPDGTLGKMIADAAVWYAEGHGKPVDFAVFNPGGIRIRALSAGPITRGMIFELMPFDNELVILEMSGEQCMQLFEAIAKQGGAPVSGLSMTRKDRQPGDVRIGGDPWEPTRTYKMITTDFLADGGDGMDFMKNALTRSALKYKFRDAIADYIEDRTRLNQHLKPIHAGRIRNN